MPFVSCQVRHGGQRGPVTTEAGAWKVPRRGGDVAFLWSRCFVGGASFVSLPFRYDIWRTAWASENHGGNRKCPGRSAGPSKRLAKQMRRMCMCSFNLSSTQGACVCSLALCSLALPSAFVFLGSKQPAQTTLCTLSSGGVADDAAEFAEFGGKDLWCTSEVNEWFFLWTTFFGYSGATWL